MKKVFKLLFLLLFPGWAFAQVGNPAQVPISDIGGEYSLASGGDTTLASNIVILSSLSGQSNSVGSNGAPVLSTTQPYSNQAWSNTALTSLIEPMPGSNTAVDNESFSSAVANELTYLQAGRVSVLDNWGVSAQPCSYFLQSGGAPYSNAQTELDEMRDAFVAANPTTSWRAGPLFWIQGENDEAVNVTAANYAANCLVTLQSTWQTSTRTTLSVSDTIPLVTVQNMNWTVSNKDVGTVSQGHWIAARDNANIWLSHSAYFLPMNSANLHYTNVGHRRNGQYMAKALRSWTQGQKWIPLSPSSITCNANVITLVVRGGDGTGITLDTTNVVQKPNYGFEYGEDTPQADLPVVTSVSTDGSNTITVTLNRNCESDGRLRYAYSAIPTSSAGPTAVGSAGGNVRRTTTTTLAQNDGTTSLYDWLVSFDDPITTCTSCTASATSSFANTGSFLSDNSPAGHLSCRAQTDLNGVSAATWSFWVRRNNASWAASDEVVVARNVVNNRQYDFRARTTGTMRFYMPTTTTDTGTYFSTANSVFTGNTWYHVVVVYNGTQTGNANRFRVWVNNSEITGGGTFTGTIGATMSSPTYSDVSIGGAGGGGGSNQEYYISHFATWAGTALGTTDISSLYNSGSPGDPTSLSTQPTHYYPLQGNGEDRGSGTSYPCRLFGTGGSWSSTHP